MLSIDYGVKKKKRMKMRELVITEAMKEKKNYGPLLLLYDG